MGCARDGCRSARPWNRATGRVCLPTQRLGESARCRPESRWSAPNQLQRPRTRHARLGPRISGTAAACWLGGPSSPARRSESDRARCRDRRSIGASSQVLTSCCPGGGQLAVKERQCHSLVQHPSTTPAGDDRGRRSGQARQSHPPVPRNSPPASLARWPRPAFGDPEGCR